MFLFLISLLLFCFHPSVKWEWIRFPGHTLSSFPSLMSADDRNLLVDSQRQFILWSSRSRQSELWMFLLTQNILFIHLIDHTRNNGRWWLFWRICHSTILFPDSATMNVEYCKKCVSYILIMCSNTRLFLQFRCCGCVAYRVPSGTRWLWSRALKSSFTQPIYSYYNTNQNIANTFIFSII